MAANHDVVRREYLQWRENACYLYDLISLHALMWPSYTVQWLPNLASTSSIQQRLVSQAKGLYAPGNHLMQTTLLVGTSTFGTASTNDNGALILEAPIPAPATEVTLSGGLSLGPASPSLPPAPISVVTRVPLKGDVHRLRILPQHPRLVVAKTSEPNLVLLGCQYDSGGDNFVKDGPLLYLTGLRRGGWALDCSPTRLGYVASGSDDGQICIWDMQWQALARASNWNKAESLAEPPPLHRGKGLYFGRRNGTICEVAALFSLDKPHGGACVSDVAFDPSAESMFSSVGDDGAFCLWDMRQPLQDDQPAMRVQAYSCHATALSFDPLQSVRLATGSQEGEVAVWDLRNTRKPTHRLRAHQDEVLQVKWAPYSRSSRWGRSEPGAKPPQGKEKGGAGDDGLLASCGRDRRVMIWDLSLSGSDCLATHRSPGPLSPARPTAETDSGKRRSKRKRCTEGASLTAKAKEAKEHLRHPLLHHELRAREQRNTGRPSAARQRQRRNLEDSARKTAELLDLQRGVPDELLFVHGGHTDAVFEVAWNEDVPWLLASVSEDNTLQVWQMNEAIHSPPSCSSQPSSPSFASFNAWALVSSKPLADSSRAGSPSHLLKANETLRTKREPSKQKRAKAKERAAGGKKKLKAAHPSLGQSAKDAEPEKVEVPYDEYASEDLLWRAQDLEFEWPELKPDCVKKVWGKGAQNETKQFYIYASKKGDTLCMLHKYFQSNVPSNYARSKGVRGRERTDKGERNKLGRGPLHNVTLGSFTNFQRLVNPNFGIEPDDAQLMKMKMKPKTFVTIPLRWPSCTECPACQCPKDDLPGGFDIED